MKSMNMLMNKEERYVQKLNVMARLGRDISGLATDPRISVGAVLFPVDCSEVSGIGYNGAAAGLPHDSIDASKGICTGQPSGAAHAEANALLKARRDIGQPMLLFTTLAPCGYCAPLIVNRGDIVGVIYDEQLMGNTAGLDLLKRAGIPCLKTSDMKPNHALIVTWSALRQMRPFQDHFAMVQEAMIIARKQESQQ